MFWKIEIIQSLFAAKVIVALQKIRVQSAVSSLFQTSAYIVRRMMEDAVGSSVRKYERKIQTVIAKARGFINFDRFRINTLFYFENLTLVPQKIY